jgi:hypothetical protein
LLLTWPRYRTSVEEENTSRCWEWINQYKSSANLFAYLQMAETEAGDTHF